MHTPIRWVSSISRPPNGRGHAAERNRGYHRRNRAEMKGPIGTLVADFGVVRQGKRLKTLHKI